MKLLRQVTAVHVMRFLEDSTFIALATNSRHQEAYEEDTVRPTPEGGSAP